MTTRVLTVIVNYRTPELTLKAASSALQAMTGIEGEIVIVENASGDGSETALRSGIADWPRCRLLVARQNDGFGAGNNIGIAAGLSDGSRPDFVYLLNPDAFPEPGAIRALLDQMVANPDCGFVGSQLLDGDGVDDVSAFRFPTALSEFVGAAHTGVISNLFPRHVVPIMGELPLCKVEWCSGASIMLRQSALDKVGTFDERFFLYFEETDLCHRLTEAGYPGLFVPGSRVLHLCSASTGQKTWKRKPTYWFDSRMLYFTKRGGRGYAVLATLAYLAGAIVWKTRVLLERKDDRIAPYFLRDLVAHTWRNLRPGAAPARGNTGAQNVAR